MIFQVWHPVPLSKHTDNNSAYFIYCSNSHIQIDHLYFLSYCALFEIRRITEIQLQNSVIEAILDEQVLKNWICLEFEAWDIQAHTYWLIKRTIFCRNSVFFLVFKFLVKIFSYFHSRIIHVYILFNFHFFLHISDFAVLQYSKHNDTMVPRVLNEDVRLINVNQIWAIESTRSCILSLQ